MLKNKSLIKTTINSSVITSNKVTAGEKNIRNSEEEWKCFGCGSTNLYSDPKRGDIICQDCGLIAEESIFFDNSNAISFAGLSTVMKEKRQRNRTKSMLVNSVYAKKIKRAKKWAHSWRDIHVVVASKELKRVISVLKLPETVYESANVLYTKVLKKNAIQGRGIYAMSAACIYIVCRLQKIPIFFSEVIKTSRVSQKNIRACYNFLMENFNLNLPIIHPKQFIPKLISTLGFNQEVEIFSNKILNKILEKNATEIRINNPKNLAIISIFFAHNILKKRNKVNAITQKEFSNRVTLSETTLRKYRRLFNCVLQNYKKSSKKRK
ncbi:MAG: TFIIB-type zinc ribbon-containing protein [Promethearchaeota archaeon]